MADRAGAARRGDERRVRRFSAGLTAALLVWNNAVQLVPAPAGAYVPRNLAAVGVVVVVARRCGLSWNDLGLARSRLGDGARWGGGTAAVVAGGLAVAAAVPALRPLLDDARVRGLDAAGVAYHAVVRIPLGTALPEELAFRGALFGALRRLVGPVPATVVSSAVFGLWHVRPTLGLLSANDLAGGPWARAGAVGGAVVITFLAGLVFCALRERSRSLLAPVLAHVATNSFAVLASAATRS